MLHYEVDERWCKATMQPSPKQTAVVHDPGAAAGELTPDSTFTLNATAFRSDRVSSAQNYRLTLPSKRAFAMICTLVNWSAVPPVPPALRGNGTMEIALNCTSQATGMMHLDSEGGRLRGFCCTQNLYWCPEYYDDAAVAMIQGSDRP